MSQLLDVLDASAAGCVSSLDVESKTLQGVKGELDLDKSGQHHLENTTLDFQKLPDKEILRMAGPLGADFTVKVRHEPSSVVTWSGPRLIKNERCFLQVRFASGADSMVQYIYYQPIVHRWRETDFFPCSVTCGGGKRGGALLAERRV